MIEVVNLRRVGDLGLLQPSKLAVPLARPQRIVRQRLLDRLTRGGDWALVLLAAPAGFGKTTLLVDLLAAQAQTSSGAAWLTLDAADNDPARFWNYVLAAFRAVYPELGAIQALLSETRLPSIDLVVTELSRALSELQRPLTLALEDYHVIENAEIHTGVAFLLEHRPPLLQLIVSSRADPPLPLARLRARGQLLEFRASDLRFTHDEAAALLDQMLDTRLSREHVDLLSERTEGWAAGLQLAGLSLRTRPEQDHAEFVSMFSGSHRFILDYLVDEVVEHLSIRTQAFLQHTAILTRLSGPLCDAVTRADHGAETLEELERSNLFLNALDDERRWYRYHALFAEALRHRLLRQMPDLVPELNRRAMDWYASHGFTTDAVEHALAAGAWGSAASLIDDVLSDLQSRGEFETVQRWLALIPDEARRQHPIALANLGLTLMGSTAYDRVLPLSKAAYEAGHTLGDSLAMGRALLLDSNMALIHGQPSNTIAFADQARACLPSTIDAATRRPACCCRWATSRSAISRRPSPSSRMPHRRPNRRSVVARAATSDFSSSSVAG